jgi:hypothetical protein
VLREELEELEDELTDCISDSIKGKQVRMVLHAGMRDMLQHQIVLLHLHTRGIRLRRSSVGTAARCGTVASHSSHVRYE